MSKGGIKDETGPHVSQEIERLRRRVVVIEKAGTPASGVTAGTYGDGTHVASVTVDRAGRVTDAEAVTITGAAPTGAAGGDLSGTYPNPSVVNDSHAHTGATLSGVVKTGDAAGGDLSGTYPNPSVVNDSHTHTSATLPALVPTVQDLTGATGAGPHALSGTPARLFVMLNNLILREVISAPSAVEFTLSGANLTLGHSLDASEPFVVWWWA